MAVQRRGSGATVAGALSAAQRCRGRADGLAAPRGLRLAPSVFRSMAGQPPLPFDRAGGAHRGPSLGIAQIHRSAALLARALRLLLGEFDEAMGLRIGIPIEIVVNIEPEETGFLLDLRGDHRRHRAGFHLTGDIGTQAINDVESAVAAFETPAHAGFCRVAVAVTEHFGVAVGEYVVEFLIHATTLNQRGRSYPTPVA